MTLRPPLTNYSEFPISCLELDLPLFVNALEVLADRLRGHMKQLCHQRLREPDGVIHQAALDARLPVLGLVKDQAGLWGEFWCGHLCMMSLWLSIGWGWERDLCRGQVS